VVIHNENSICRTKNIWSCRAIKLYYYIISINYNDVPIKIECCRELESNNLPLIENDYYSIKIKSIPLHSFTEYYFSYCIYALQNTNWHFDYILEVLNLINFGFNFRIGSLVTQLCVVSEHSNINLQKILGIYYKKKS